MSEVVIHEDESFERALKRFKKKCEKAGILSDLRKHRHYEKPSEKRKRKMNAAQRKNRRSGRRRMSEIAARLRADQIASRKAADKDRTLVLGTVLASLKNRELDLGKPATDADAVDVLRKQIKQRLDSVEQYRKGAREDLASREEFEIAVLKGYLPPDADPEEIRAAAREAILAGTTDLGRLMGVLMGRFKGKVDGKVLNQIAREALQQG